MGGKLITHWGSNPHWKPGFTNPVGRGLIHIAPSPMSTPLVLFYITILNLKSEIRNPETYQITELESNPPVKFKGYLAPNPNPLISRYLKNILYSSDGHGHRYLDI